MNSRAIQNRRIVIFLTTIFYKTIIVCTELLSDFCAVFFWTGIHQTKKT